MEKNPPPDSAWRLRVDLASAKVLIWAASVGRDVELSPDTHLYLATRYDRLAQVHVCAAASPKRGGLHVSPRSTIWPVGGVVRRTRPHWRCRDLSGG